MQAGLDDPVRVAALEALTDIAEVMRVLVETTVVYDQEAEPAIRLSLVLINARPAAILRMLHARRRDSVLPVSAPWLPPILA